LKFTFLELAESTKSYGKYLLYAHFEVSTHPFLYVVIHKNNIKRMSVRLQMDIQLIIHLYSKKRIW